MKTQARRDPCYYYNTRPTHEPASRELTSERCTRFVFCVSQTLQIPTYPELNLKLCISSESPCPPLHKPQLYMTNTGFNLHEMSSCGSARSQMHVFSGAVIKSVWCSLRAVCAVSELKLKVIMPGRFHAASCNRRGIKDAFGFSTHRRVISPASTLSHEPRL